MLQGTYNIYLNKLLAQIIVLSLGIRSNNTIIPPYNNTGLVRTFENELLFF